MAVYNRRRAQYYVTHPTVTRYERLQFFNPTPKGQERKPREYYLWYGLNFGDSWEGAGLQSPESATSSKWAGSTGWPAKVLNLGSTSADADMISLQNLSYSRLQEGVKRASLGVTVAEGREALTLMAQRAGQLYRSFKFLKKGRFGDFARELKVRPLKKHERTKWTKPKHAASIWLEYWFGWAPLVGDINACVDVLTSAPPPLILTGSASRRIQGSGFTATSQTIVQSQYTGKAIVKQHVRVRIENPNALLRQQAGLTNAAEIAWAVVPFSFLVDWFGNVGDVLRARTDFSGLVIEEAWTTAHCKLKSARSLSSMPGTASYRKWSGMNEQVCTRRLTRVIGPTLQFKLPQRLSVTRAATAISLLVSLFTKG